MARVPDYIVKTVAFLAPANQPLAFRGTAFLVGYPLEGWDKNQYPPQSLEQFSDTPHADYLVTASHVIEKMKSNGVDSVLLRANKVDGEMYQTQILLEEWEQLPNDLETGFFQDVAACPFPAIAGVDLMSVSLTQSALPNRVKHADIGIGDDLFFPGLFSHREGTGKNMPILRKGTLAAMVDWDEPIVVLGPYGDHVEMATHLAETRSIGGLSGSPVFAHPAGVRDALDGKAVLKSHGHFFLLGLISGHWDQKADDEENVNMGIGYVTPVEKIVELLENDRFEKHRQTMLEAVKEQ